MFCIYNIFALINSEGNIYLVNYRYKSYYCDINLQETFMQQHTVKGLFSPMRLDRYLRQRNPDLSQAMIEKYLRKGGVRVNSSKAKSSLRVVDGDLILYKPELSLDQSATERRESFLPPVIKLSEKILGEYLIFQDENILVINKPAGLAVQGGTNIKLSIDDALQFLNSKGHGMKICHRLDRDTSGLLLIAKNRLVATRIMEGFKEQLITKKYYAIVAGKISNINPIESYLYTTKNSAGERVQTNQEHESDSSKYALTHWQLIESNSGLHLLLMSPKTGRMHQLRCHSLLISEGIVGDRKYFVSSLKKYNTRNLMLHACRMSLDKSILGREYQFAANAPQSFVSFLELQCGISLPEALQ